MAKILIINGPNLNMLGVREPDVYGAKTLAEIESETQLEAQKFKLELTWFQSNSEGEIVTKIHELVDSEYVGLIINPGAYSHTSLALFDALKILKIPIAEVHISNVFKREGARQELLTGGACDVIMCGPNYSVYGNAAYALSKLC